MNWQRGILLAGINLALVIPAFVREEARYWPHTGTDFSTRFGAQVESVAFQEGIAVPVDPCDWFDIGAPRLEEVGALANLPTALLTGWHESCLTRTALGRVVRRVIGARNHFAEITDCAVLSALVFIQWAFVGGFPLVRPKRWWLEPGAFITAAAVVGAALALIPTVNSLAKVLAIVAGFGWFWWFGLLLWKPIQLTWQSTLAGFRRLTS